jgi:hypothetical protein
MVTSIAGPVPAMASHSDPKPATTTSLYVNTTSLSTLRDRGCAAANRVDAGTDPKAGEVILAFGAPRKIDANTYGATLFIGAYSTSTSRNWRSATREASSSVSTPPQGCFGEWGWVRAISSPPR